MTKGGNPDQLTLDDLHQKLSDCFACFIDEEVHNSEKDKELNGNFQRLFKGACQYCQK